jgi:beta-N-acetylhexosaminidase
MSLGPLMIDLRGPVLEDDEREWLASPAVGGVILFKRNCVDFAQLKQLVADIHAARSPALLVAVDQEGGRVQRFREPFTVLPPLRALGHLYDRDREAALAAARGFGWLMGAELRAVGVDLCFSPVVDLDRGLSEVIGDRALHSDPVPVRELAGRLIDGATEAGLAVTAKHFPTHAGALADSHTDVAVDRRPYSELLDDLDPYRYLIERDLHAIMLAHVIFPAVDPQPASLSSWWITTQLRRELGFTGAVISDDMSMQGASVAGGLSDRVARALEAGCDLVLLCNTPERIPPVLDQLRNHLNPPAHLRLTRLRGKRGLDWDALRSTSAWSEARRLVDALNERPALSLEG